MSLDVAALIFVLCSVSFRDFENQTSLPSSSLLSSQTSSLPLQPSPTSSPLLPSSVISFQTFSSGPLPLSPCHFPPPRPPHFLSNHHITLTKRRNPNQMSIRTIYTCVRLKGRLLRGRIVKMKNLETAASLLPSCGLPGRREKKKK